jgi:phage terminase large subunit GpA-like protein
LDGFVYAYAAAIRAGLMRVNWDQLERDIMPNQAERTEEWQDNVRYYPERKPMQRPVQNLNGRRMNPWKNR